MIDLNKTEPTVEEKSALVQLLHRVGEGSALLGPELVAKVGAFCRRGHRPDLTGLAAQLGVIARWSAIGGGCWVVWQIVQHERWVVWPLVGGWALAAARRARRAAAPEPASETPTDDSVEPASETPAEPALPALVRAEIGGERGVHLQVLYPAMRAALPGLSEAPDEELRLALREAGIPVRKKLRARGVAGRSGVHREDLPPLPSPEGAPEGVSAPVSTNGDAVQSTSAETSGDRQETGAETVLRIVADPDNPHRHHVHHVTKKAG